MVPFPVSWVTAAQNVRELDRRVAQNGIDALKQQALDDILSADNSVNPTPTERLRALYKDAYTQQELKGLIDRTFQQFGIREQS
ncbi:MAG: hypothetical protein AAGJ68_15135 [Pseudomonadota bacterium]